MGPLSEKDHKEIKDRLDLIREYRSVWAQDCIWLDRMLEAHDWEKARADRAEALLYPRFTGADATLNY